MKDASIHDAVGRREYTAAARFRTADGRTIGVVRHSGELLSGKFQASMLRPRGMWHYHETDGVAHCTRTIDGSDILRVAS